MRWSAVLLVVLLIATVCGDDDDDSGGATETTAAATSATVATTAGAARDDAGAWVTTPSVATSGAKTILGSGIPSGDACSKTALADVPGVSDTEIRVGGVVGGHRPDRHPVRDIGRGPAGLLQGRERRRRGLWPSTEVRADGRRPGRDVAQPAGALDNSSRRTASSPSRR